MPINPIQNLPLRNSQLETLLNNPARTGSAGPGGAAETISSGTGPSPTSAFAQLLDQSIRHITEQQDSANQAIGDFLDGNQEDPHRMMLAVQRADLTFDMFVQVRNKVISAYQEIMRMPE